MMCISSMLKNGGIKNKKVIKRSKVNVIGDNVFGVRKAEKRPCRFRKRRRCQILMKRRNRRHIEESRPNTQVIPEEKEQDPPYEA
jgi:hypothetical protein